MKLYIVHKHVWNDREFKYSDGSDGYSLWKTSLIGGVYTDRLSAHNELLNEGFEPANIEWFSSDYSRKGRVKEPFKWDEADIIEREVIA